LVHDRKYQEKIVEVAATSFAPTHLTQNSQEQKDPEDGDTFISSGSLDAGWLAANNLNNSGQLTTLLAQSSRL
jgi:hypothetical protein